MATIKFLVNAKNDNAQIILQLSVKRGVTPKRKTGLNHQRPKPKNAKNRPKIAGKEATTPLFYVVSFHRQRKTNHPTPPATSLRVNFHKR